MLMMYEAEIADWYEKFERGEITKGNYSKIRDELVNKQFVLINKFKSDIEKNAYPNTFAKDGETEFCGKCGTAI